MPQCRDHQVIRPRHRTVGSTLVRGSARAVQRTCNGRPIGSFSASAPLERWGFEAVQWRSMGVAVFVYASLFSSFSREQLVAVVRSAGHHWFGDPIVGRERALLQSSQKRYRPDTVAAGRGFSRGAAPLGRGVKRTGRSPRG